MCNLATSDNHENFDSMMSFKIFVALEKVWPHFLKHLQSLKEAYLDDFLDGEGVPMPDFYEFNNMDNPVAGRAR